MPKPKRSYKIKRFKRFSLKNVSTVTATRFKDQIDRLVELLRIWLIVQDNSEKEAIAIMESLGVPTEKRVYYLAYIKQQINRALLFEIETMLIELGIKIDIWEKRGLEEMVLKELQQPQEKWGAIYSYFLTILKNAYMDYCFIDYCKVW
jgi:hypothetical protein